MSLAMDTVMVAVRVRPLVANELLSGCRPCLDVNTDAKQIVTRVKRDAFTFNHVFDSDTPQIDVYSEAVESLVSRLFEGYNVTVLAYGQTGSGKTYSMGTSPCSSSSEQGIIPRAIKDIFDHIENTPDWEYTVSVSFLELYNEALIDLLSARCQQVDLRENSTGVYVPGLTLHPADCAADVLQCLTQGSANRTTAATAMNAQSSRSHAIFTINIRQVKRNQDDQAMSAKFHLVDLAGSERPKKTKSEGARFREGVNINRGLFSLGNVISALGEGAPFVNYRDSKLTRLLQDSLGGNSMTLMLACVSPADSNLDESVNTMRYADRARKIKNKPIVNQDPNKQEILRLQREVEKLQLELLSQQSTGHCPPEHLNLAEQKQSLQEKNRLLSASLEQALRHATHLLERTAMAEATGEKMKEILTSLDGEFCESKDASPNSAVTLLRNLRNKLQLLKNEHERSETERIKYEENLCMDASENIQALSQVDDSIMDDEVSREEHVLGQAKLNDEIEQLAKDLAWKEALAVKLAENYSIEASINPHQEDITMLKTQIDKLLQEKQELEQQLKNQQSTAINHKIAEQRRKRVKELEDKINGLHKKLVEQDRIIKIKEKNDEKIKVLNSEISLMKQMKVRLINQMKSEGEKYRQWRSTRDQEVCKLRQQNRREQSKFIKMENQYQKQQNVYRRKLEESTAVIRRLKDTLALQKSAKEKKTANLGNSEKVNTWVSQQVNSLVSVLEAEQTLEGLKDDRKMLAQQLSKLEESMTVNTNCVEKRELEKKIKSLKQDLELRSTQIIDLQQKLQSVECYQDGKPKILLSSIQTMNDAKLALKCMFETTHAHLSEIYKDKAAQEASMMEMHANHDGILEKLDEKDHALREQNAKWKKTVSDCEEKIHQLLEKIADLEENNKKLVLMTLPLQDSSNNSSQSNPFYSRMRELEERNMELEKKLNEKKNKLKKKVVKSDDWNSMITPETRRQFYDCSDDDSGDNTENDPDWKKTPIYKRMVSMKKENKAVKRKLSGQTMCGCTGDCATLRCSCRKVNAVCNGECKCLDEHCQNKIKREDSSGSSTDNSPSNPADVSFKKPR